MSGALVHRWSDLESDRPMEKIERRRVVGERAMLSLVVLSEGCDVPTHRHDNEQFAHVLRGRIRFGLGERDTPGYREVEVAAGEVLQLPGGVPHSAYAIEESEVLDVFAPPSETTGIDRR
ncbi:MAG: cupin domain-containing protein [bacterium]|nr:cupin domain-containing protein [bacterium]